MQYALNSQQMKEADSRMIQQMGIPSLVLMERAALETVAAMKEEGTDLSRALIVCGSGNNGGDGFAIARLLAEEGCRPETVFVGKMESRSPETRQQMEILEHMGIPAGNTWEKEEYSVIIDAVFGIGLSRPVEGHYKEVLEQMNRCRGRKVAVDIPSGISADTGDIMGCAFQADITVTFAYPKVGLLLYPGKSVAGKVLVRKVGIWNPEFRNREDVCFTLDREDILKRSPLRPEDSHKGTYGKLLLIAGSEGMCGAAYLAAKAAYKAGAGLVRIYTEETNRVILQQLLPEALISTWRQQDGDVPKGLMSLMEWADVICLGSGLGKREIAVNIVRAVLDYGQKPCLIDADGLNILSRFLEDEKEKIAGGDYVFTPHMMEMSRLSGYGVEELKQERLALLREFTEEYRAVCVMKDSRTLVGEKGKPVYISTSGCAAMAKAGSGDVLAGTIAGLMAQHMSGYDAAVLGVYLHGLAGCLAEKEKGSYSVMAGDLPEYAGKIWRELEDAQK